ncbi:MAG: metallophosphoesterase family protein, partial [Thermoplasmata archaeon]|nr:metallophosphoesterase family protein [Thermoplasmata archaeon]
MSAVDFESPQPVHEERGLILGDEKGKKVLVISDIHIGFEEELMRDGIYIPNQTPEITKRAKELVNSHEIERVVINGDLKHRVPKTQWKYRKKKLDELDKEGKSFQEEFQKKIREITERMKISSPQGRKELQKEFEALERKKAEFYRDKRKKRLSILEKSETELRNVALFLREVIEIAEVDIIPGNHDGRILKELENSFPTLKSEANLRFHTSGGLVVGNAGIFHGHAWPSAEVMAQDYLIMGHGHAAILLTDSLGVRSYEHCWLRAPLTDKVHEKYLD